MSKINRLGEIIGPELIQARDLLVVGDLVWKNGDVVFVPNPAGKYTVMYFNRYLGLWEVEEEHRSKCLKLQTDHPSPIPG